MSVDTAVAFKVPAPRRAGTLAVVPELSVVEQPTAVDTAESEPTLAVRRSTSLHEPPATLFDLTAGSAPGWFW
jgi:hypothetical protein